MKLPSNEVRIIAGKWRGRKITFPSIEGLRPTADRLRETVFNWLQFDIAGKICLDAFAGSGALGLEALSRGARTVTFLDSSPLVVEQLKKMMQLLKADDKQILQQDALSFLQTCSEQYDLIFIDPPFKEKLWLSCLELIEKRKILRPEGRVYLEMPNTEQLTVVTNWRVLKESHAGQVTGRLLGLTH